MVVVVVVVVVVEHVSLGQLRAYTQCLFVLDTCSTCPQIGRRSIPYPLLLVLFLQNGWTATLIAAYKGHLTVLETLVEQYGGNVLHRMKVKWLVF